MEHIEEHLEEMEKKIDSIKDRCLCGKYNKNGKGLYCFKHKKQTPDEAM